MSNPPTSEDLRTLETMHSENRKLRWEVRQLGKQLGRAGRTIFALRNEVAALRQTLAIPPGDYERLFRSSRALRDVNAQLRDANHQLQAANHHLQADLAAREVSTS